MKDLRRFFFGTWVKYKRPGQRAARSVSKTCWRRPCSTAPYTTRKGQNWWRKLA